MTRVSHWYGRLGNNIQQVAVATMAAEMLKSTFNLDIDHEIIKKHQVTFGQGTEELSSKWFYWEGPYKEVGIEPAYIYQNMRRICRHILPHLDVPTQEVQDADTICIHIRSGDIFARDRTPSADYVPNPLYYYLELLERFSKAIVVTEPDADNPIVAILEKHPKVTVQSKSVAEDFATLLSAKNLASSGVGTFAIAAALCSQNIENFFCTDLHITEHLNFNMLMNTDVSLNVMGLDNYIKPGEWKNDEQQRKLLIDYYPVEAEDC